MTNSATLVQSGLHWEQRILDRLSFMRWQWLPGNPVRMAAQVFAIAVVILCPAWLSIPVGVTLIPLVVTYWTAFSVKVIREFRGGYRGNG